MLVHESEKFGSNAPGLATSNGALAQQEFPKGHRAKPECIKSIDSIVQDLSRKRRTAPSFLDPLKGPDAKWQVWGCNTAGNERFGTVGIAYVHRVNDNSECGSLCRPYFFDGYAPVCYVRD